MATTGYTSRLRRFGGTRRISLLPPGAFALASVSKDRQSQERTINTNSVPYPRTGCTPGAVPLAGEQA